MCERKEKISKKNEEPAHRAALYDNTQRWEKLYKILTGFVI